MGTFGGQAGGGSLDHGQGTRLVAGFGVGGSQDRHEAFIRTIVDSFHIIPLGGWNLNAEIIAFLVKGTSDIFILGIRLAAPVMVALLLTSVTLGIMARAFPQMNIFMVSMPLNIGIGFVVLGLSLTIFFHVLTAAFGSVSGQIETLFRLMSKGG